MADRGKQREEPFDKLTAHKATSNVEGLPLEVSGQLYRHLFESLNDAAFIADAETGLILQTNYAAVRLLGRSRDEIIGMHQSELHSPGEAERYKEKFARHVREGRAADNDGEVLRKDGARVPVTISASTLEIGKRKLIIGLFRDISEKKRAEETLRQSEERFRRLVEHLPQRIFVKDRNSVYVSCNATYARDLGIAPEQIAGKDDSAFYPPELTGAYRADDQAVMASGTPKDIEERYQISGQERWVHTVKLPYCDEQGRVVGVLGIFDDITERKRIEEALRRSEELFKMLAESAPIGIFLTDVQGNTRYVNGKSRRIYGLLEGEISGDRWQEAVHPDDVQRVMANQEKAARDGTPLEQDFRIVRPDGETRWVHTRTVILPAVHGAPGGILGMIEDVTDIRRAEEDKLLSAKLEAVLELAGAACHELNQPLQVVSGFAQLIRDQMPQESPLRSDIGKMLDGVEKLAAITRKLNGITRYETKDYLKGWKIVDLDKSAAGGDAPGGSDEG